MAERPVECGNCKRPIRVIYKEVVGEMTTVTEMCAECPILKEKLHGTSYIPQPEGKKEETGLCCIHCRTSLESILMGNPLGCNVCYDVFGDIILHDLENTDRIAPRTKKARELQSGQALHIGKSPKQPIHITPSSRIHSLNEALNEALRKENYEQAAWLRDQIKELMDKPNEGKS